MISPRTGSSTPHSAGAGEASASPAIFDTGKVWPIAASKRFKNGHQRVTDVFLAQHFEVIPNHDQHCPPVDNYPQVKCDRPKERA